MQTELFTFANDTAACNLLVYVILFTNTSSVITDGCSSIRLISLLCACVLGDKQNYRIFNQMTKLKQPSDVFVIENNSYLIS